MMLSREELIGELQSEDPKRTAALFAAARRVRSECGRDQVLPRGLVECSNVCARDCLYCGIRASNLHCRRYRMTEEEVMSAVSEARRRGYPAVAFQSGEIVSEANAAFYERLLARLRAEGGLEVTLSLGEQDEGVYRRWKAAAGDLVLRYLLRIESSNREIFGRIHPRDESFDRRLEAIRTLKRLGYVTGTGVMVGLPGQTVEDLADDLLFFQREQVHMVGMGPYIPHADTPLGRAPSAALWPPARRLTLSLKMIALSRILLRDVNIVAATALAALDPEHGRDLGLAAGANVIMPDLTPDRFRADYDLYPGKAEAR